jgi:sigma-B regulation protein RsbU (phosphoserine phosphatase)
VDDDLGQRELISRAVQKLNAAFHIESCPSGYDAIIRIGAFRPDIVVLDLMMPNVDGFQVCRAVRSVPDTKEAKILVVTGYGTDENIRRAEVAGADDWLSKPFRVEELRSKVASLLKLEELTKP